MEEPAFIVLCVVALLSNAFLLTILLKHEKGWSLGKTILVFLHVIEVVSLLVQVIPYIVVVATAPRVPGSNPVIYLPDYDIECAPSAVVGNFVVTMEPWILAMLAHVRWRVVKSSRDFNQKGESPPVRRMIAILVVVVVINTVIGELSSGGMYTWSTINLCLSIDVTYAGTVLFISFFFCAAYIGYCYRNVIKVLRESEAAGGHHRQNKKRMEATRLLLVLTGYYYLSHSPFFFRLVADIVTSSNSIGILGGRITVIIYVTYAMMAPILSIMLTARYRTYAKQMLYLSSWGSTLSGSNEDKTAASTDSFQSSSNAVEGGLSSANRGGGFAKKKLSIASSVSSSAPPSVFRSSIVSSASPRSSDRRFEKQRMRNGSRDAAATSPRKSSGFTSPHDAKFSSSSSGAGAAGLSASDTGTGVGVPSDATRNSIDTYRVDVDRLEGARNTGLTPLPPRGAGAVSGNNVDKTQNGASFPRHVRRSA